MVLSGADLVGRCLSQGKSDWLRPTMAAPWLGKIMHVADEFFKFFFINRQEVFWKFYLLYFLIKRNCIHDFSFKA